MRPSVILFMTVVCIGFFSSVPAHAETVNCTNVPGPTTINAAGIYCLTADIVANVGGTIITILASDVVLDLNGHRIENTVGPGDAASCLYVGVGGWHNITIKNGTVRGCRIGMEIQTNTQNVIIDSLRVDRSTYVGIWVQGQNTVIRNTHVSWVGGTTLFGTNADAYGIFLHSHSSGGQVEHTTIYGTWAVGSGNAYGLLTAGVNTLALHNRITSGRFGIYFAAPGTGKYQHNITLGVTTPYTGGTDAGNNQ